MRRTTDADLHMYEPAVSQRRLIAPRVLALAVAAALLTSPVAQADTLLSWQEVGQFPTGMGEVATVVVGGYMYAVPHNTSGPVCEQLHYSPLSDLHTWTSAGSLQLAHAQEFALAATGNYIYAVGGHQFGGAADGSAIVEFAAVDPTTGAPGPWQTTSALSQARANSRAIVRGDYLYVVGGHATPSESSSLTSVEYARINADGTLGSWSTTSALNAARPLPALAIADDRLYAIGGSVHSYFAYASEFTAIDPTNGALGAWSTPQAPPGQRGGAGAVAVDGTMYLIGGFEAAFGGSPTNEVLGAEIKANGSLGAWVANTSIPDTHRSDVRAHVALVDDVIYVTTGDKVYRTSDIAVPLPTAVWGGLAMFGVMGGVKVLRRRWRTA